MDRNYSERSSILIGILDDKKRVTLLTDESGSLLYGNGGKKTYNMREHNVLAAFTTKEGGVNSIHISCGCTPKIFAWDSSRNIEITVTTTDIIYRIIPLKRDEDNENKPLLRHIYIE